jgi:uncharacterized membrane protein YebE (DUF533 family)
LARCAAGNWYSTQIRKDGKEPRDVSTRVQMLCWGSGATRRLPPENAEKFRETRRQDYNLLLINEAVAGRTDGHVDPVELRAITQRDVAASRRRGSSIGRAQP